MLDTPIFERWEPLCVRWGQFLGVDGGDRSSTTPSQPKPLTFLSL